ncbi:MAG TPA: MMPL family transporter [Mycobacteriales bacterium]|nr:MMPL family transporter [Mycobacteriales bacterium]
MTRHPWLVIGGWVVATVAIIAVAPGLSSVTNTDQASFLPHSAESVRALAVADRAFPRAGGSSAVAVVSRTDSGPLGPADVTRVEKVAAAVNQARIGHLRLVRFDPTVDPTELSTNRRIALIRLSFDGTAQQQGVKDAVGRARAVIAGQLRGGDLRAGLTGEAALQVDNDSAFGRAERITAAVTVVLIVVLLLVIFRSPVAALLPILSVGLVFGLASSIIAMVAAGVGFQVGQELSALLTVVLFGIGTDYILFLLFRYRERLRAGDDPTAAMVAAVERVGQAIASAAFAVIAAFAALTLATLGFYRTLGPGLAIAVAVMLLAALTLVPAIVTLLGTRVFWPSRSWRRRPERTWFARLGAGVARRPAAVVGGAVVVLVGLAAGVLGFHPDFDQISQLPAGTESAQAYDTLQRGFSLGALSPTEIYLTGDRALTEPDLSRFASRLREVPGVASVGLAQPGAGHSAVIPVLLTDSPYSNAALDAVAGPLRDAAHRAAPAGARALVGGQTSALADVRQATNRDLSVIFPVAGLLFLLILAGLLRAVVAPLYLVPAVVLGFVATLGASVLVFQVGLGHAGLAFSIPIIMYLFVTAIGTDYNILMTARLREEAAEGNDPRRSVALAVEHAGPSVAAAAVILSGTFGSLLISGVSFFYEIGFAVTLGILLVAFVVSLLLVPAMTALVGPAAWWPGHGDRAAERVWPPEEERELAAAVGE